METNKKYQVIIGYHTHEQTKKQFPIYDTEQSPVPTREVHPSLEFRETGLQITGIQMFVGTDCSYNDYIKIIKYAAKNPIRKEVFENTIKKLMEEIKNAEL